MAEHPYIGLWDKIAALRVSPQEKAVLWCLARHSHWDNGAGAFPSVHLIARATSLSKRQVRRYLGSLRCDPTEPCTGDAGCRHRGILIVQREASQHRPTMYALDLEEIAFQMHLPEVRKIVTEKKPRARKKLRPPIDRFWEKVDRGELDDCWLWIAAQAGGDYGHFWVDGKMVSAHRWIYEQEIGPIPDGLTIDHLCGNPPCVNTAHLEPVTMRENVLRSSGISAQNARKTHCRHGHPFNDDNTYYYSDGSRDCRICIRFRSQQHKERLAMQGTPDQPRMEQREGT